MPPDKLEYQVLNSKMLISAEQLNEQAADGWELVAIVPHPQMGVYYFYFKRWVT
jgi:hypothetical protein